MCSLRVFAESWSPLRNLLVSSVIYFSTDISSHLLASTSYADHLGSLWDNLFRILSFRDLCTLSTPYYHILYLITRYTSLLSMNGLTMFVLLSKENNFIIIATDGICWCNQIWKMLLRGSQTLSLLNYPCFISEQNRWHRDPFPSCQRQERGNNAFRAYRCYIFDIRVWSPPTFDGPFCRKWKEGDGIKLCESIAHFPKCIR